MFKLLIVVLFSIGSANCFLADRDVRFLLNTRRNIGLAQQLILGNLDSILKSNFDRNKPTRIIIHGFQQNEEGNLNINTSRALLEHYDFNIVFVDWSAGSQTINYLAARNRIRDVARVTSTLINILQTYGLLDLRRLGLVGFSLGAHAAGLVGKSIKRGKINTIIGIEPAGPLFSVSNRDERIDAGDAEYVECIHTNGGLLGAGIGTPICHADFFPNGGRSQPGCWTSGCSHSRAVSLYIESLVNNTFFARACESTRSMSRRNCHFEPSALMGGEPSNYKFNLRGIFYLETNRNSPYGQGVW